MKKILLLILTWAFVPAQGLWAGSEEAVMALWDRGLFNGTPGDILQTAQATDFPPDQGAVILYEQGILRYAADGTLTKTRRLVYRIQSEDAVRDWGSVKVSWSPWHQSRPVVKARIINPDGSVWAFDPAVLVEGKSSNGDGVYSDDQVLEGPYPHVQIGSIVEEEILTVSQPLLPGGGIFSQWNFGRGTPVMVGRLTIQSDARLPSHIQTYGTPQVELKYSEKDGNKVWDGVKTRLFFPKETEANLPRDLAVYPYVAFSTADSWEKLAESYSRMIEDKVGRSTAVLPPETVVKGSLEKTAVNLMKWINKKVRYVGLELGQNSIVPYTPQEILGRGYGDCKDKAVLLVSFLRQAGYKAHVALVWNGSDKDIVTEVPGINVFNHAIVYVESDKPLWLDPTSDFSRDEVLPYWDQERWALPAKAGSQLVRTPLTQAARQETTETRDYYLKDSGAADVTEQTLYGGDFDLIFRQKYAFADPVDAKKGLENYTQKSYADGKLDTYQYSEPRDLEKNFTFTLKVKETGLARTGDDDAAVVIKPRYLLSWLPDSMTSKTSPVRTKDYRMNLPFVLHWIHRIHLPEGFVVRSLPDAVDKSLGSLKLSRRSRSPDGRTVEVAYDFTVTKSQLTAGEFEASRQAILADSEDFDDLEVVMDLQARLDLNDGRFREAFDGYRKMIAADPTKAIHPLRFSKALLQAGFGEQAIEYAQKAAALAPKDGAVLNNLAWCLQFDKLGRRFGSGYDRKAALDAYRQALAVEGKSWGLRADYAILLEFNEDGLRYENKADLEEAVKQYDAIEDELEPHEMAVNRLLDLWYLGRFDEVGKKAVFLTKTNQKQIYLLASAAALKGAASAVRTLPASLDAKSRQQVLAEAATLLTMVRKYADSAVLLRAASRGSSDAVNLDYRADLLSKLQTSADGVMPIKEPSQAFQAYYLSMESSAGRDFSAAKAIMTPELYGWLSQTGKFYGFDQEWLSLAQGAKSQSLPLAVLQDVALGSAQNKVEGNDAQGYHVAVSAGNVSLGFFLKKAGDNYLIAAQTKVSGSLAGELEAFLKNGQVPAAAQWIDWFMADIAPLKNTYATSLAVLWPSAGPRDGPAVQRFADVLRAWMARNPGDLKAARERFSHSSGDERRSLALGLVNGMRELKDFQGAADILDQMENKENDSVLMDSFQHFLYNSGQFDRLEVLLKKQLDTKPSDQGYQLDLLQFYIRKPDAQAARQWLKKTGLTMDESAYNNLAWCELFSPQLSPEALENARKSVMLGQEKNRASMHTLATLYAENGRLEEAHQVLFKSFALSNNSEPLPEDWYVLGRIAEGYGFFKTAREDYQRVMPEPGNTLSVHILAQKRLTNLPKDEK